MKVMLETRDGWHKVMNVPAGERYVKVAFTPGDFTNGREQWDRVVSFRLMHFERSGDYIQTYDPWGDVQTLEIWREQ